MSKIAAYFHIVFCTKSRQVTIPLDYADDLYRFVWKQVDDLGCRLIRIGGIQNHIHMLVNLHSSVPLSQLMQNIKGRSSTWMKSDPRFAHFVGWSTDYYASSVSPEHRDAVIEYIKSQRAHHLGHPVEHELETLYATSGLPFDPRDLL